MTTENSSKHSKDHYIPDKQRALVLQGGGALGAYEAGVLEVLCKKIAEENDGREDGLLFDIVAGTSIGAMNAAIFVSQFLETRNWNKAAEKLQNFWTDQLAVKGMDISEISKPWYDHWKKRDEPNTASPEEARRYYSVRRLLLDQVGNNMYYLSESAPDKRFFDNLYQENGPNTDNCDCKDPNCKKPNFLNNFWMVHSSMPLQESIEKYAKLPISTDYKDNQPRLLIFSVDVAEGVTVTFDSYPKTKDSRKSVYGKSNEIVIEYNDGIEIEHVMASGTVPVFYKYAIVPIHSKDKQANEDSTSNPKNADGNNKNIRYFFDGGWLSNTPFRELLTAHQDYWKYKSNGGKIPDLDVYIVNVHPSKYGSPELREDHDGVTERANDIIYSDRTSHYDEKMAHLITDYANLCRQLNDRITTDYANLCSQINTLVDDQVKDEKTKQIFKNRLNDITSTHVDDEDEIILRRKYKDLVESAFDLSVVMRVERRGYVNNTSAKTGDLTFETIKKLIIEGKCDAWFTIIEKSINDAKLDDKNKCVLIEALHNVGQNLEKKDYEDNDSQAYQLLTEFIKMVEAEKGLEKHHLRNLVASAREILSILD
jgi:NTE family protein